MSIEVDFKLLFAAVRALGITIPVRSARKLEDGSVEVCTRDGVQVWNPPGVQTAPESVSKSVARRKRAKPAGKMEVTSGTDE